MGFRGLLLDDHEAGRVVGFVGDADVRREALGLEPALELAVQHDDRLAAGQLGDLARAPGHGHAHAHADGLAERLLGGEAGGQEADAALGPALGALAPGGEFAVGQDAAREAVAMRSSDSRMRRTSQMSVPMP
jgi:hypothetical protein